MYTHDELVANPQRLLERAEKSLRACTFSEGLLGAVLNDGTSFITTPNARYIPEPPQRLRAVQLRIDYLYGVDDPILWPQPFHRHLPHLPLIPCRADDDHKVLWNLPERDLFRIHDEASFTGLGSLDGRLLAEIRKHFEAALAKIESATGTKTPEEQRVIDSLQDDFAHFYRRLECLPCGFRTCQVLLRSLQRAVLEMEAMALYLTVHKARMAEEGSVPSVVSTVGAYVSSAADAEALYRAGIPFWFIRPVSHLSEIRIEKLASLATPTDMRVCVDRSPHHPVVYNGAFSDPKKLVAISWFTKSLNRYPDPFITPGIPEAIRSTAVHKVGAGRQRYQALNRAERDRKFASPYTLKKMEKKGIQLSRSKFDDPVSTFFPPPILTWKKAQLNVDQDTSKFIFEENRTDMGYVLPEPAWLVSTKTVDKSRALLRSWLHYRPALLYRLSSPNFRVLPVQTDAWTALLAAQYIASRALNQKDDGRAHRRQKLIEEWKMALGNAIGQESEVDLSTSMDVGSQSVHWRGIAFDDLKDAHFEQILWELSELNFRFELQALDNRASMSQALERHSLIAACFPDNLLVADFSSANRGIASSNLRELAHFLFAMARVMKSWRSVDPHGWIMRWNQLKWSEQELRLLEEEVAIVYTQSFYNHFRRAAILPRRLSDAARLAWVDSPPPSTPTLAPVLETQGTLTIINTFVTG